MKIIIYAALMICTQLANAQFTEQFSDGELANNPTWIGGTADWTVNALHKLQSNNTVPNSSFYLSTVNTLATNAQWEFYCQLGFNPSGANYADVFLTASASDLTLSGTTGYFVRIGNTNDEICLYRKDAGSITKIIDGADGVLNSSNNVMKIKVVRNASNQWILSRDLGGTGNSYITEGTFTDATYLSAAYFGILVKQSTASFFQKHFFDDIEVKDYVPDIIPPVIQSVIATSINNLDILFNEPVDAVSSQTLANYVVSNGIGFPSSAILDASNPSIVHLSFTGSFPARTNLTLTIDHVSDISGNAIINGISMFSFYSSMQYDLVIDELMADPSPVVGLPDVEWIEIKNTTSFSIDLQDWRIGKTTGQSGPMPPYILRPDSFVVICSAISLPAMAAFGPAIAVSAFPSLNNTGDLLFLRSPQGMIVHAVNYSDSWYQNELKKDGGWTLEMIDTHNPCAGISNWIASTDARGGTPAKINKADAVNTDQVSPKLMRAFTSDSLNIVLVFNEPLDSVSAAVTSNYNISDGIGTVLTATPISPLFNRVKLQLPAALVHDKIYTVTVNNLSDCMGNLVATSNTARVGLYDHTDSFDIIVNEVLFNPKPTSNDYVEIYNRSNKVLNLENISIANRTATGTISNIKQLNNDDYLLFPGDLLLITESMKLVLLDYVATNPDAFIEISSMPSFNDDKGNVILLNEQGNIVDELAYSDQWHFSLISNDEGISLERINYDAATQNKDNWHSAASSVGFGTPTYKNSQNTVDAPVKGEITVSPEIISPDNDGVDDFASIDYRFPEPGYVAGITIYDASGRPVRLLERNALCGTSGYFRWDGLNEQHQPLPSGIYIIYAEIFNLKGKTKKFKQVIVLARSSK